MNPVERINRTINAAIRTYVKDDQRQWDTKVPEIEMVLNSSIHSSTGHTPFFVTHGREMSEVGSDHRLVRHDEELTQEQREARKQQMFADLYDIVSKNLSKAHDSTTKTYNLRHHKFAKAFVPGQLVYRKNMKLSNAAEHYNAKYGRQFLPCRVVNKHGTSSYELEDLTGKNLGIWPAVHLKPG